jgi:hypothetical protein
MTTDRDDVDLEALLRAAHPADMPGDDLVARVLADAARVQAERAAVSAAPAPVPRRGWLGALVQTIGGWPAVSGVALAGLTGLVIGFAVPDLVDSWSGGQIWTLSGGGGTVPEIGALWDGTWEEMGDV